jgi:hypothetical protein
MKTSIKITSLLLLATLAFTACEEVVVEPLFNESAQAKENVTTRESDVVTRNNDKSPR